MKIYLITNTVNGKRYVGKTYYTDVGRRFREHLNESRQLHKKRSLTRAIRKYGESSFIVQELDTANTPEELSQKEIEWIARLGTYPREYNMTRGGDGGSYERSEATKEKMRQQTLSRSPEFWEYHKVTSTAANQRPEFREKMSAVMRKYYETHDNPLKGRSLPEKVKIKMREAARTRDNTKIGKYARTDETRQAISEQRKGKATGNQNAMSNPINRAKVGASKIGRKLHIGPNGERKMFIPNTAPDGFTLAQ